MANCHASRVQRTSTRRHLMKLQNILLSLGAACLSVSLCAAQPRRVQRGRHQDLRHLQPTLSPQPVLSLQPVGNHLKHSPLQRARRLLPVVKHLRLSPRRVVRNHLQVVRRLRLSLPPAVLNRLPPGRLLKHNLRAVKRPPDNLAKLALPDKMVCPTLLAQR
jgi:hypothetical protein